MRFDEGIADGYTVVHFTQNPCYNEAEMYENEQSRSAPNTPTSLRRKTRVNCLKEDERRRNSLPTSTEQSHKIISDGQFSPRRKPLRIRSFKTTTKGTPAPTKGDRRESNASVMSLTDFNRARFNSETSEDSAVYSSSTSSSVGYYRVSIMGADAVGKRTLTNQFMSSERMSSEIFEIGDLDDNMVTVVIDNEESTLEFVDCSEAIDHKYPVDAYIVVFSVHERPTFDIALQYLNSIRNEKYSDRPIILVANKVDLVRKRQISHEEAKRTATQFNCKYIETSATLNVKVDELLVGILKQIKLTLKPEPTKSKESFVKGPIDILARLFHMKSKVKSKYDDVLI